MAAHAELSASGAHRWMACPGSVRLSRGLPNKESEYAAEGTAAHQLAEECLRTGNDAADCIGGEFNGYTVGQAMADAVQVYVDYVRALPGPLFIEEQVSFNHWVPGGFGTVDALNLATPTLFVTDLKFGLGVRVDAEWNPQGMLYALGALTEYGWCGPFKHVSITIVQPRRDHISTFDIPTADLLDWAAHTLAPSAQLAGADDAPAVPGDKQCRWCLAKGTCAALADHVLSTALDGFEALDIVSPEERESGIVTPPTVGALLTQIPLIENWVKGVRAEAFDTLSAGGDVPGWKLVHGRGHRRWRDEAAAERALATAKLKMNERFKKTLISPAQAEKLLGKGHGLLTKHVETPLGAPTLAPENDKRPAIVTSATEGFENVNPTTEKELANV